VEIRCTYADSALRFRAANLFEDALELLLTQLSLDLPPLRHGNQHRFDLLRLVGLSNLQGIHWNFNFRIRVNFGKYSFKLAYVLREHFDSGFATTSSFSYRSAGAYALQPLGHSGGENRRLIDR
jgi:hypothetical protein